VRGAAPHVGVLAFFAALTLAVTFPLVRHLGTHVAHFGDSPFHLAWVLAWGAHALARHPAGLFDANLAWPIERSFAFSEHLLGLQPLFAPVYAVSADATAGYNVVFLLSFTLSAFTGYLLAREWTGRPWAALAAGALFGFAPFRLGHVNHLHVLVFFWTPLALLFLERFVQRRRDRDLWAFAAAAWLQTLSSAYLGAFTAVAVGLHLALAAWRDRLLLARPTLLRLGAVAAATLLVLGPLHWPYVEVRRTWGMPWTLRSFAGADLRDFLVAPEINPVYVTLSRLIVPAPADDRMLFPGLVLPALALVGAFAPIASLPPERVRRLRRLFGVMALVALVLALGPYLTVWGARTRVPLPYLALASAVPGFGAIRIPSRFVMLALLAAAPLAALGAVRLGELAARWSAAPGWRAAAPAATALAVIAVALVELGPRPLTLAESPTARPPEAYRWLARHRPGPVVELPVGDATDLRHLYLSTLHWLPVVTPRGSFAPPSHDALRAALAEAPAPRALEYAAALGVGAIVVDTATSPADALARWRAREHRAPAIDRLAAFPRHLVYGVAPAATTTTLRADLNAPPRVPPGVDARLGLLLSTGDGRPWVQPAPRGRWRVVVHWRGETTTARTDVQVAPPLVIGGEERAPVAVRVKTPEEPGRYAVWLQVPGLRAGTTPRAVDVVDSPMARSDRADAPLGAAYAWDGPARPEARALDWLPLRLTATNSGPAVWLARAVHNRGEVRLRWRWLRGDQPLPELDGEARLGHDVFPGQRYGFAAEARVPAEPGTYRLEVGLASVGLRSFADAGTPALMVTVDVGP